MALITAIAALGFAFPTPRPSNQPATPHPSTLPGDPSLILNTNVALKSKSDFMKAASRSISTTLSKPETYVAVCVTDNQDIVWAGEDTPCALGVIYSLGSINQSNNAALTAALSSLLEEHGGIPSDRIYINFFDMPRARARSNCHPRPPCLSCQNLSRGAHDLAAMPCLDAGENIGWSGRTFAG